MDLVSGFVLGCLFMAFVLMMSGYLRSPVASATYATDMQRIVRDLNVIIMA